MQEAHFSCFLFLVFYINESDVIYDSVYVSCQVDPFLNLVDDCKLEANDTGSQHSSITFGSKEDDVSASKFVSEIEITEDQSRESLASVIVKSLENSSNVSLNDYQLSLKNFCFLKLKSTKIKSTKKKCFKCY